MKPGREYLDPLNRIVVLIRLVNDLAIVKLTGPYGATIAYPQSVLRPVP